jgi:ubiquinone/menaquinone biosynthesis C-methylase UbiE
MNDEREAKRLANKVDADTWVAQYVTPNLAASKSLLDVGCGPGILAIAVAQAHSELEVTGIGVSPDRLAALKKILPSNVRLQVGDARSLPFEDDTFDFVYCRFLLEYLAARQKAADELVRVCRPGGRVMLQDLDGQFLWHHPEDEALRGQIERVFAGLSNIGFDPFIGRKLFSIAKMAGLVDLRVIAESYHLYAGRIDDWNLQLWETKLDIAMPVIANILESEDAAKSLKSRFLDYLLRDDSLTYSVVFTVVGTKPSGARDLF